jgi:methoxymalonate biosynthesis acyl carrier protein
VPSTKDTAIMSNEIKSQIHGFVANRYPQTPISDDEDIFSLGFINSLFAMELVMFIEKTFGITIPNEELQIGNFRTAKAMTVLVERQLVTAGQG